MFNPFPNKPWFLLVCSISLLKALQEKKKLLVTSNFSFAHSVFYPFQKLYAIFIKFEIVFCKLFQFGRVENLLFVILKMKMTNQVPNCHMFINYFYRHLKIEQAVALSKDQLSQFNNKWENFL